jgi:hypothetical protein
MPQYVAGTFRSVMPALLAHYRVTEAEGRRQHCANG